MKEALVVWWDKENNDTVEIDAPGFSCFDVVGVLQTALELAEERLPSVRHMHEIEDE